jgi:exodeoxyribonuclease VII large subunit
MEQRCESSLDAARSELTKNSAVLGALNPSAALARGYTMTLDADGKFVRSAKALSAGQTITTQFPDGRVDSVVGAPPQPDGGDGV